MKSLKHIHLDIDRGEVIKAETLEQAILDHENIETVILFWTWTKEYYTSNAGPFEAYVTENRIDEEYSIQCDREDALKFAKDYGCWDGEDFVILNGNILYGYREEYDNQSSWNDGYDNVLGIGSGGIDPSWIGLIRADVDYKEDVEYLIEPGPIPKHQGE